MKSIHIATIKNTSFLIHPAFLIFFLYAGIVGCLKLAVVSTVSILLHECAHAAAASILGSSLKSMELTPMGALLRAGDLDNLSKPKRTVIILAGPVCTWGICILSIALAKTNLVSLNLCRIFCLSNLSILMMNLLPVYPLDGGRLLALIMENFLKSHTVFRIMKTIGETIGVALICLNLYTVWKHGGWNLSLSLAGCCIISAACVETTTFAMSEIRDFLDRKINLEKKRMMPTAIITILHTTPLITAVRKLPRHRMLIYLCLEAGSMRVLGYLAESELLQIYMKKPYLSIGEALNMSQNRIPESKYDTI